MPEVDAPEPTPSLPDRSRPAPPWHRDPVGLTLLATGATTVVVGGILWGLGGRELDRAPGASVEEAYERQVAQGRRDIAIGSTLAMIGTGLAIGGAARLGVVARRHRARVTGWLRPGAGGLGLWARF